ncbi:MAG: prolyl oligopeptidase family serine peptidase [Calditrichia bacterium]
MLPYGTWPSNFSPESIAAGGKRFGDIRTDDETVYWLESRPLEKGRNTLMRLQDGEIRELLPEPYNVRSNVHEYGGAAFTVHKGTVYFVNHLDKEIYRLTPTSKAPQRLTEEPNIRYADLCVDEHRKRLIFVREDHSTDSREPINTLATLSLESGENTSELLVSGADFYSSPTIRNDGTEMAWLCWNHPQLPWDGTELQVAAFNSEGRIESVQTIAGSASESVFQPMWSSKGELYFSSDRNGWWNIHCCRNEKVEAVVEMEAEFAWPQWVFGMSTNAIVTDRFLACAYTRAGLWRLGIIDLQTKRLTQIELPYSWIDQLRATSKKLFFYAASPSRGKELVALSLANEKLQVIAKAAEKEPDPREISVAELLTFGSDGVEVQAFFYSPKNPYVNPSENEKPPLIVLGHSGPTAATDNAYNPKIQYWTSRGFAVLDVNYRGSTSFGRNYREMLNGQWGVADVADCVNGARFVAETGRVDPERLIIRGSSAGGFTALAALTFHAVFSAGAVIYGIGDLEALTKETHKFEARYNDTLVAPYPEGKAIYKQRSPLFQADQISVPVIFFQGLDDKVVLPEQSESMVEALKQQGIEVTLVTYEGEGHGFRKPQTIVDSLEKELAFYEKIFGFQPS